MDTSRLFTLVQARTASTRRPGKVLAEFPNGPLLIDAVYERADAIGYPVCLAIPRGDIELERVCLLREWQYVCGSEYDVLERFVEAATVLEADHVIRVCGDSPFTDPVAAQETVRWHLAEKADLTWDQAEGRGVQVLRSAALRIAHTRADQIPAKWRESPDEFILGHPGLFRIELMKWSIDSPEDLEIARRRAHGTY